MGENLKGLNPKSGSNSSINRLGVEASGISHERFCTVSPRPWDLVLQSLSETLPVIFHSPPDQQHLYPMEQQPQNIGPISPRNSNALLRNLPQPLTERPKSSYQEEHPGNGGDSDHLTTSSSSRPIRVRHEETEEKLNQSLSAICRSKGPGKSSSWRDDEDMADGGAKRSGLKLKESLKTGIRLKISVSSYDLDRIAVSVTKENKLIVYIVGEERRILHVHQLNENPPLQSIVCSIIDGTSLYIRERSKEVTILEYSGSSERYLPVVKMDETALNFIIILHVCEEIKFEDIIIKTIDESLIIKGEGQMSRVSFKVYMTLPECSDNRSVIGHLTAFNQVVIEGRLCPTSRRMTCIF